MAGGRPTGYKPEYCQMLIEHMREGRSFSTFAAKVDAGIETIYGWARVHSEFSDAKEKGRALEMLWWEDLHRAGCAGRIPNYNAASVIFALKNKDPARWRDRYDVQQTIAIENKPLSLAEVKQAISDDPFIEVEFKKDET